jgi:oligopeptidase A
MNSINPLLDHKQYPDYSRINSNAIDEAVESLKVKVPEDLKNLEKIALTAGDDFQTFVEAYESLGTFVARTWAPVSHLVSVATTPELRKAHEKHLSTIIKLNLEVAQNEKIYKFFLAFKEDKKRWEKLNNTEKRIVDLILLDAKHSGIGLPPEKQTEFNQIADELAAVQTSYTNNILDATKAFHLIVEDKKKIDGLTKADFEIASQTYLKFHPEAKTTPESGPWAFTLDHPVYSAFMREVKDRELRKQMYKAQSSRASAGTFDNRALVPKIIELKTRKAKILGYKNYAELSLASKMAQKSENVLKLMSEVKEHAKSAAQLEEKQLLEFASSKGFVGQLEHWDISFWSERLKEELYQFNEEQLKEYFTLDTVLSGLFGLTTDLFQVEIRRADGKVPIWDKNVQFYEVYSSDNRLLAAFYFDPFARPENKRGGAWLGSLQGRRNSRLQKDIPVAFVVCNSAPPVSGRPPLLTLREVQTLFHEFGHCLQHILTTVDYATVSGIDGVEWDAVELASQFMENFIYQESTMAKISSHYKTREPLPMEFLHKVEAAKNYRVGNLYLRQLTFGFLDMHLYEKVDILAAPEKERAQVLQKTYQNIFNENNLRRVDPDDQFLCSFSHIFAGGYSAGYYSYLWADVLSADAFSAFEEVGLENVEQLAKVGIKFRDTVLALGGSMHPAEVFRKFRGRDPSTAALLRHKGLLAS